MKPAEIDTIVFDALCEAVSTRAPCPSGRILGRLFGGSEYSANRSLYRLRDASRIKLVTLSHPWRRKVTIPGVGETDWSSTAGAGHAAKRNLNEPPMQRMTDERNPWTGDCFAVHDKDPGDHCGSVSRPETLVPRCGVLA